ncbi:MAG TPA: hypothetical protein VM450_14805 [Thermomicrobiales bacterium]|nr:hypothetical protein [Thermomicrobiales bacterium]
MGDDVERHVKAGRTEKNEARGEDPAATAGGIQPPVPSYTDEGGVSDLGVDEPVLPEADADDSPPTGMYAGETEASAAEEDEARRRLEEWFPSTRGDWKDSGAVPENDTDA